MRPRLPAFLSAFRFASFRRLWTGAFLSSIGTWTQDVALAWVIHTRIGDPFYLGLRTFAAEMPLIAFMLIGGANADRVDRKRILLASQLVQMGFAVLLGVLYATGRLTIGPILAIAFVTGLAQSQSAPTYQAVLTTVVPARFIPNAVALNSLQFNLSRAVGPVVAGLLLARGGTAACFLVNAVSFVGVIAAIRSLQIPPPPPRAPETLASSLRAGFAHVWAAPLLRDFMAFGLMGSLLAYPLITYLPVFAGDVLKTGAAGYSLLLSSFGAGAILGAVTTAQRGHVPGRGRLLCVALVVYSLAATAAMAVRSERAAMALLFLAGAAMVTGFSTLNSLVQENAVDAFRGRVLSIYGLAFRGGMPIGSLVAGVLVREAGVPVVIGSFSLLLAAIAAGHLAWSRQIRHL
jgi:predicted MFS family arabinose efflux permease